MDTESTSNELLEAIVRVCRRVQQLLMVYEEGRDPDKLDCLVYHVGRLQRMAMALDNCSTQVIEATSRSLTLLEDLNSLSGNSSTSQAATLQTSHRGRPKFDIAQDQLEYLLSIGFHCPAIADLFGVSLSTVRRRMSDFGLSVTALYSSITDYELELLVRDILRDFPNCGYRLMHGHLLQRGHRVIQARIRETLHRVDPEGVIIRWSTAVERRKYSVASPLSLWHIDGNHKLIRYAKYTAGYYWLL